MKRKKTASDILLASIPSEKRAESSSKFSRDQYISEIKVVKTLVMQQVSEISNIGSLIPVNVAESKDRLLSELLGKLIDKLDVVKNELDVFKQSFQELEQIKDDETFLVTSFHVLETVQSIQTRITNDCLPAYERCSDRIEVIKKKVKK